MHGQDRSPPEENGNRRPRLGAFGMVLCACTPLQPPPNQPEALSVTPGSDGFEQRPPRLVSVASAGIPVAPNS